MSDENEQDDNLEESSPQDNQEDSNVSEDEETLDQDEEYELEEEAEEEPEEKPAPFHEHPRFKELISSNRDLKEQIAKMESKRTEEQQVASMDKEQRAVHELKTKYGFATKDDMKAVQLENARLKEQFEFEKFLKANPDAADKAEVIQDLAFTPKYKEKSYEAIYKEVFQGSESGRKVVKRRVRTGMKSTSSTGSKVTGKKVFTREQISAMSSEQFRKNEAAIERQMKKGLIK
jgi:hypothetical protein